MAKKAAKKRTAAPSARKRSAPLTKPVKSAKPAKKTISRKAEKPSPLPYLRKTHITPRNVVVPNSWSVPELCKAYNWPADLNGGGVIAIIELNGGWVQPDMDAYFNSIGQPAPLITDVPLGSVTNNPGQHINNPYADPDHEVALDIQVAAASYYVATGKPADIRVYWAPNIPSGIQAATTDNCDVCSISWGGDEAYLDPDMVQRMEDAATDATKAGMIVFAASGDNDSSDGGSAPNNVDAPASCPHVIGCGGTTKTASGEAVWNNDPGNASGHGSGGGFSKIFTPMPSFQQNAPNGSGRMVPDVAGNAGFKIYVHGAPLSGTGGTSAVAPLYAGLFAAFGTKLGFVTPKLWENQLCFNDITQGDNGAYRATPGPDPCTGLGSPIGTKLAALLAKTAP
jgi:subtilase family serine protease